MAGSPKLAVNATATIIAAIACTTLGGIGLSLSTPLISLRMAASGYSGTMIGLNAAVFSIATLIFAPHIPRIAGRIGVTGLLLISLVMGGVSLAAFPLSDSLVAWFVLRFLFGASIGTMFVLSEFWINAAAPAASRGFVMGIYATALSLGFAAGPAILAVAGDLSDRLFWIGASFFVIAAVPILLAGGDTPPLEGSSSRSAWSFIRLAPVATFAGFVFGAVEQACFAFLPIFGTGIGLDTGKAVLLLSLLTLGNVVSQLPLGALSDRMDRRVLLLICTLTGCVGALVMPLVGSSSFVILGVVVFVTGGVVGGLYTVGLAHLGARFTGPELATANAAFVMLYALGMLTGSPMIGLAVDALPPNGFVWGFAALCGAYGLLVVWRLFARKA